MSGDESTPIVEGDSWCTSDINGSANGTFTWKIKGFKEFHPTYSILGTKSSVFTIRGDRDSRWMLEIKPNTIKTSIYVDESVKVLVHSKNSGEVKAQINLSLANSSGTKEFCVNKAHTFNGESSIEVSLSTYWKHIISSGYERILPNGDLNVVCTLTTFGSSTTTLSTKGMMKVSETQTEGYTNLHNSYKTMSENYNQLFLSKEMSDVQIKCGDQTFDAHQVILSARSPVFRTMLQTEMKERRTGLIEIKELNPNIILEVLKFIYTGKLCISDKAPDSNFVAGILEAADKYQLDILAEMCGDILLSTITPENALELLTLGDMYGAEGLKKHSLDLVVSNVKTILGSDEWKECAKKRPNLFVDISEALAVNI